MVDDDHLLRRCQQGDDNALDELLRRYQEPIYRLAVRILGDATTAQDAAAAALVKIWTKANQWRGDAAAGTWIYRLAYRTILDTQRGQRRWWQRWWRDIPATTSSAEPTPEEDALAQEQHQQVHAALQQLSPEERAVVHLYYLEQRPLKEIADITGATRAALKMRLLRARQHLRVLLEDLGDSF